MFNSSLEQQPVTRAMFCGFHVILFLLCDNHRMVLLECVLQVFRALVVSDRLRGEIYKRTRRSVVRCSIAQTPDRAWPFVWCGRHVPRV